MKTNELSKALAILFHYYKLALEDEAIHKPIAWALYQTWMEVDKDERLQARD